MAVEKRDERDDESGATWLDDGSLSLHPSWDDGRLVDPTKSRKGLGMDGITVDPSHSGCQC